MKKLFVVVALLAFLVSYLNIREDCDDCKLLQRKIRYQKTIDSLDELMYEQMQCPKCNN